ncbi:SAF domain-containing protein [Mesorhizobium sp. M0074]|uniref:SAF domain-containing protein n=1 Tax=Mesorhizobium sp. M0074 TaxID=2956869 RepID=UPI00333C103C
MTELNNHFRRQSTGRSKKGFLPQARAADLAASSKVRKYADVIGRLTAPVVAGDHVHVHNLESLREV